MTFSDDIAKFVKTTERRLKKVIVDSTLSLSTNIIKLTPIDMPRGMHDPDTIGVARAGWYISYNGYSTRGTGLEKDPTGSNTIQKVASQLRRYNLREHTSIHLNNNVPYINKLEFGGYDYKPENRVKSTPEGFSMQAPAGMVRVSTPMWPVMVVNATVSARALS